MSSKNLNKEIEEDDLVPGEIIEIAERIVIDYANFSGRADSRPEFRGATIKHLLSLHSTWVKEQKEKIESLIQKLPTEEQWYRENGDEIQARNEAIDDIINLLNSKE